MEIYIGLIAIILIFALLVKTKVPNKAQQEQLILRFSMLLIFLLLALKAETVGVDIAGYKEHYESTKFLDWGDLDHRHFEPGYIAVTMLFAKIGLPFQFFMAVVYACWCHAIYLLIKKFSPDTTLSVIVFICYSFFVFSISGVRQTIAMTFCLYAFFLFLQKRKQNKIISVLLAVVATFMHQSAVVFLITYAILFIKKQPKISLWLLITLATFALRPLIWNVVILLYGADSTPFTMGGNFIFLIGMVILISFTYFHTHQKPPSGSQLNDTECTVDFDDFSVRAAFLCIILFIVFSGSTMLRVNMFYMLFLIPAIPRAISRYTPKTRFILGAAMGMFMLYLFYTETLAVNQLGLCPYKFFWQV